jgi:hypothetical protein
MPLDNNNLIDEVTAKRLRKLHSIQNSPKLIKQYMEFVLKEKHCSKIIVNLINKSAKTIIHNTMFSDMPREEEEEAFGEGVEENFLESDPGAFEVPDGYDPIDKCVDVYQAFVNTQFLMQLVFSSGLAHGKAIYEGNLETSFEGLKKTPSLFDTNQASSIKQLLSDIVGFNVDSYEITSEEIEGIDKEDRRQTREEDEDPPEELF